MMTVMAANRISAVRAWIVTSPDPLNDPKIPCYGSAIPDDCLGPPRSEVATEPAGKGVEMVLSSSEIIYLCKTCGAWKYSPPIAACSFCGAWDWRLRT